MARTRIGSVVRSVAIPGTGLAMMAGTLAWGAMMGDFPPWLLGMGAASLVVILLGALWQEAGNLRDTVVSLVYTFFVILCVVFVYLISANRSDRIDITQGKIHTLSPQTVAFLAQLDTRTQVVSFSDVQNYESLNRFFRLYERETGLIAFEIYDPAIDPVMARRFGETVMPGDLYVTTYENNVQRRRLRIHLEATDPRREYRLTNALAETAKGTDEKIYVTQGKGERSLAAPSDDPGGRIDDSESISELVRVLSESVMPVKPINLYSENRVPTDAALIVVASPQLDLFDSEREMLFDYIDEGGALLVLIDPMMIPNRQLKNLEAVLEYVGIESANNVVIDPRMNPPTQVVAGGMTDHEIVEASGVSALWMDYARPLEASPGLTEKEVRLSVLVGTHNQVWQEDAKQLFATQRTQQPEDSSRIHAVAVAMSSHTPSPNGTRSREARIVAFGDSDFLVNSRIGSGDTARLALQTVNWLARPERQLDIPPKLLEPSSLTLTRKGYWLMVGSLLLLGLVILVGGVSLTVARRRSG